MKKIIFFILIPYSVIASIGISFDIEAESIEKENLIKNMFINEFKQFDDVWFPISTNPTFLFEIKFMNIKPGTIRTYYVISISIHEYESIEWIDKIVSDIILKAYIEEKVNYGKRYKGTGLYMCSSDLLLDSIKKIVFSINKIHFEPIRKKILIIHAQP